MNLTTIYYTSANRHVCAWSSTRLLSYGGRHCLGLLRIPTLAIACLCFGDCDQYFEKLVEPGNVKSGDLSFQITVSSF